MEEIDGISELEILTTGNMIRVTFLIRNSAHIKHHDIDGVRYYNVVYKIYGKVLFKNETLISYDSKPRGGTRKTLKPVHLR